MAHTPNGPRYAARSSEAVKESEVESEETESEWPKQTSEGSSWYELSNGEKVQGEDNAVEAEAKLH